MARQRRRQPPSLPRRQPQPPPPTGFTRTSTVHLEDDNDLLLWVWRPLPPSRWLHAVASFLASDMVMVVVMAAGSASHCSDRTSTLAWRVRPPLLVGFLLAPMRWRPDPSGGGGCVAQSLRGGGNGGGVGLRRPSCGDGLPTLRGRDARSICFFILFKTFCREPYLDLDTCLPRASGAAHGKRALCRQTVCRERFAESRS